MFAASLSFAGRHRFERSNPLCSGCYELRFPTLLHAGRNIAFPCDAGGHVDIDSLGERERADYFYARTVIGREFLAPVTCSVGERTGE
jgi:hypothetical protein